MIARILGHVRQAVLDYLDGRTRRERAEIARIVTDAIASTRRRHNPSADAEDRELN